MPKAIKKQFLINVIWQIVGNILPMLVAILVMPAITTRLGADRLGILSIGMSLLAFQTLLTLGVDRASTKIITEVFADDNFDKLATTFKTGLILTAVIGGIASLIFLVGASFLARNIFNIPTFINEEAVQAFHIFAGWLFVELLSTPFSSILMAKGRYGLLSLMRSLIAIGTYLVLFVAAIFQIYFPFALIFILMLRLLVYFVAATLIARHNRLLFSQGKFSYEVAKTYIRFGKWVSLYGIISPFNMHFDRILLGSMLSSASVAFYSIPTDLIMRASLIPASFSVVIFPKLVTNQGGKINESEQLSSLSIQFIILLFSPIYIVLCIFSEELLGFWLGTVFSAQSWAVASIVSGGMLIGSVKPVFWSMVEAKGRPDLLGKLYILIGVLNIPLVYYLVENQGIIGAAVSFTIRTVIETFAVAFIAKFSMNFAWATIFGGLNNTRKYASLATLVLTLVLIKSIFSNISMLLYTLISLIIFYSFMFKQHLNLNFSDLRGFFSKMSFKKN